VSVVVDDTTEQGCQQDHTAQGLGLKTQGQFQGQNLQGQGQGHTLKAFAAVTGGNRRPAITEERRIEGHKLVFRPRPRPWFQQGRCSARIRTVEFYCY